MIKTKTQEPHNNCPLFKETKRENKTILTLYKKKNNGITKKKGY